MSLCFASECQRRDFPEKATFWVRSFTGSFTCPPEGTKPDLQSNFNVELFNRSTCQYLAEWPEFGGRFVGFYNDTTKMLYGSWYLDYFKTFGSLGFKWNGKGSMIGSWLGYPNIHGCDRLTLLEEDTPVV
eukprot:g6849.t1